MEGERGRESERRGEVRRGGRIGGCRGGAQGRIGREGGRRGTRDNKERGKKGVIGREGGIEDRDGKGQRDTEEWGEEKEEEVCKRAGKSGEKGGGGMGRRM